MTILSRRLPPLSTLVVFNAAYRLRSFSGAAEGVALSQASVSRQIRQLETNLGVRLFNRQRHDVMPTEKGEILAATVHLTLRELASTAERLRSTGAGCNSFTIFSDVSIASGLIISILNEFQQWYSELQGGQAPVRRFPSGSVGARFAANMAVRGPRIGMPNW